MSDPCLPAWDVTYRLGQAATSGSGEPIYWSLPTQGPDPTQRITTEAKAVRTLPDRAASRQDPPLHELSTSGDSSISHQQGDIPRISGHPASSNFASVSSGQSTGYQRVNAEPSTSNPSSVHRDSFDISQGSGDNEEDTDYLEPVVRQSRKFKGVTVVTFYNEASSALLEPIKLDPAKTIVLGAAYMNRITGGRQSAQGKKPKAQVWIWKTRPTSDTEVSQGWVQCEVDTDLRHISTSELYLALPNGLRPAWVSKTTAHRSPNQFQLIPPDKGVHRVAPRNPTR